MTIQIRPAGGGMAYAPQRDLAQCWQTAVKEVAMRLEHPKHPFIAEILKREHVTMDELGRACEAFCLFCVAACQNPDESMSQVLSRVGWFALPPAAQVAYMALLGQASAGMFFSGLRDITYLGEDVNASVRQLRTHARRALLIFSMTPLQRFWYRCTRPWARGWRRWRHQRRSRRNVYVGEGGSNETSTQLHPEASAGQRDTGAV